MVETLVDDFFAASLIHDHGEKLTFVRIRILRRRVRCVRNLCDSCGRRGSSRANPAIKNNSSLAVINSSLAVINSSLAVINSSLAVINSSLAVINSSVAVMNSSLAVI